MNELKLQVNSSEYLRNQSTKWLVIQCLSLSPQKDRWWDFCSLSRITLYFCSFICERFTNKDSIHLSREGLNEKLVKYKNRNSQLKYFFDNRKQAVQLEVFNSSSKIKMTLKNCIRFTHFRASDIWRHVTFTKTKQEHLVLVFPTKCISRPEEKIS